MEKFTLLAKIAAGSDDIDKIHLCFTMEQVWISLANFGRFLSKILRFFYHEKVVIFPV